MQKIHFFFFSELGSKYQAPRDVTEIKLCINYTNEKKKKRQKRKKKKTEDELKKCRGVGPTTVWVGGAAR